MSNNILSNIDSKLAAGVIGGVAFGFLAGKCPWFSCSKKCTKVQKCCPAPQAAAPAEPVAPVESSPYNLDSLSAADYVPTLEAVFNKLVADFIQDTKDQYDMPQAACDRLHRLFHYNVLGGKYYRGTLVLNTVKTICAEKNISSKDYTMQSLVLGWCIEILQACFLVADDLMDKSITRRGKPCWYLVEDVKNDAVNDSLILESFIYFLLKKTFKSHPAYIELVELYQTVSLSTQLGQMLDLTSQPQGRKDPDVLKGFNLEVYHRIVKYKTAIYTFYLPIASGMILCGYNSKSQLDKAHEICVELGTKFQIEDDYLDCYGEPSKIGKIGTDIKDHKCSWLCVQALKLANEEQMEVFKKHYGKEEDESEAIIKQLYRDLDLEKVYEEQEETSFNKIASLINESSTILPASVFLPILKMIHRRQK